MVPGARTLDAHHDKPASVGENGPACQLTWLGHPDRRIQHRRCARRLCPRVLRGKKQSAGPIPPARRPDAMDFVSHRPSCPPRMPLPSIAENPPRYGRHAATLHDRLLQTQATAGRAGQWSVSHLCPICPSDSLACSAPGDPRCATRDLEISWVCAGGGKGAVAVGCYRWAFLCHRKGRMHMGSWIRSGVWLAAAGLAQATGAAGEDSMQGSVPKTCTKGSDRVPGAVGLYDRPVGNHSGQRRSTRALADPDKPIDLSLTFTPRQESLRKSANRRKRRGSGR